MVDLNSYVVAVESINALGIDLLRRLNKPGLNTLLSPYSIQCALALAHTGADGETKAEMAQVLHYPAEVAEIYRSFTALRDSLDDICRRSCAVPEPMKWWDLLQGYCSPGLSRSPIPKQRSVSFDPMVLLVANRVFVQTGFELRESFIELLKYLHPAQFESLNFAMDPAGSVKYINTWVEEQTRNRIRNLIPEGCLDTRSTLVIANAIYFKASWRNAFKESETRHRPFYLQTDEAISVPTMTGRMDIGFAESEGFVMVTLAYDMDDLQFTILMPDRIDRLPELGKRLDPMLLKKCARLATRKMTLHLPKLRLELPVMQLSKELQSLGMKTAFDLPPGSANFEGIAASCQEGHIMLSEIFHKAFLSVDEKGTVAAAGSAPAWTFSAPVDVEVHVDRPFFFAIQHRESGACLFLGCLADPR